MFGYQLVGIFVLIAWGTVTCLALFGSLKMLKILRVDSRTEVHGQDSVKHDEPAYPAESWEEQQYWDHQVHRLIHLLGSNGNNRTIDLEASNNKNNSSLFASLPPQMNFAHLVLTDHFQKCVLSLDARRTIKRL